jgi:hypothetical protein
LIILSLLVSANSGAGKTTLMYLLQGHTLTAFTKGVRRWKCVEQVAGHAIGHDSQSETSVTTIRIAEGRIYADTPGTEDTGGPRAALANSVGHQHLFTRVNKVKIALTIRLSDISVRGTQFTKLIDRLIQLHNGTPVSIGPPLDRVGLWYLADLSL